jgi:hypothetical protein
MKPSSHTTISGVQRAKNANYMQAHQTCTGKGLSHCPHAQKPASSVKPSLRRVGAINTCILALFACDSMAGHAPTTVKPSRRLQNGLWLFQSLPVIYMALRSLAVLCKHMDAAVVNQGCWWWRIWVQRHAISLRRNYGNVDTCLNQFDVGHGDVR